jgi:serine phosphatase RsbU (regulator of sigma subunit)
MSSAGGTNAGITRVLLVEDDEGDAFLVRELLAEVGAPVDIAIARSLGEARTHLSDDYGYDCVLLDLGLPDAEGLDALRATLAVAGKAAVLCLTGLDDEHLGVAAVSAGAQDYLVKGQVDGHLLRRSIQYAVERKRTDEQLRELYASELRAAENARMERGLLPRPELHDASVSVVTRYRPGREAVLGGDFYDVVETADGTLYLLIGDVSGHGPDEAALGVCLRIAWRTLVLSGLVRTRLLPVLEEVLIRERRSEEVFATLCMVVVEPHRRAATLFLAGHPAPLLLGEEPLQLPDDLVGPALGVLPGVLWGSRTLELSPGWRLLLFTDGLVEGRTAVPGERLGVDGLLGLAVASQWYADSAPLVDDLIHQARELHGGDLTDDLAVLAVTHAAPGMTVTVRMTSATSAAP